MGRTEQDRAEKIAAAFLVAFGLFVAYYSYHYLKLGMMIMPGAGFLPFSIGVILAVLGAAWYAKVLAARPVPPSDGCGGAEGPKAQSVQEPNLVLARLFPGILLVVLYAWLFERAGYILSTLLFMFSWQKAVEREGWAKSVVAAAVSAAFMYLLFARLLKVFLPSGTWWD